MTKSYSRDVQVLMKILQNQKNITDTIQEKLEKKLAFI